MEFDDVTSAGKLLHVRAAKYIGYDCRWSAHLLFIIVSPLTQSVDKPQSPMVYC